jgi:hypothetical protein
VTADGAFSPNGSKAGKTVSKVYACTVEWYQQQGQWKFKEVPGSEFVLPADLSVGDRVCPCCPRRPVQDLGLQLDDRGNVVANTFQTSVPWVRLPAIPSTRFAGRPRHRQRRRRQAASRSIMAQEFP